jgi:two-component system cell cycle response regulator DivK
MPARSVQYETSGKTVAVVDLSAIMLSTSPRPSSHAVLIVDDCPDTRAMYGDCLAAQGFTVTGAASAAAALQAVATIHPDVIVTDLMLPGGMNGLELTRRLRLDDRTRDVPIVLLTGSVADDNRELAAEAGCTRFLPKPCAVDLLISEINRLLDRRPN